LRFFYSLKENDSKIIHRVSYFFSVTAVFLLFCNEQLFTTALLCQFRCNVKLYVLNATATNNPTLGTICWFITRHTLVWKGILVAVFFSVQISRRRWYRLAWNLSVPDTPSPFGGCISGIPKSEILGLNFGVTC